GLGFVCGAVSRGLELFDFDHRAAYVQFKELAIETGYGALVERIEGGYLEDTPGDGVHWFYYCDPVKTSTKLARRYKTAEEYTDSDWKNVKEAERLGKPPYRPIKTLIETKGEGGYAVVAPSFGNVHPSRLPYRILRGGIDTIARITSEERDALWGLAKTLDEIVEAALATVIPKPASQSSDDGTPPWEDFNARSTWEEILEPRGW